MNIGESTVLEKVQRPTSGARHITLIDPAKQSADVAAQRAMLAVECGSAMIFIGGSTDTPDDVVHATCTAIQEAFELRMFAAARTQRATSINGISQSCCFQAVLMHSRPLPMPSRS